METYYLILVIVLVALAISDLVVGVSNDAVNFLNSAIGSKAAPFKLVMAVAAVGIFIGAAFSNGMMEVARKGIFNPESFFFYDIMVIFIAVMITDVILLDLFNTYGLPTSTTVSIVFELLGAAVAVSAIKIYTQVDALTMSEYINTAKALGIISGILLSVVISFTVGALIQYLTRIIFSFNYEKPMKYFGAIFGGISVTIITHFLLVKGAKDLSFLEGNVKDFVDNNVWLIMIYSLIFWTIFLQILNWIFKMNILVFVVLIGTFALAMAFAGNDLVNFIGVPLAGYQAFKIFLANPGVDPETLSMAALSGKVNTPTFFLLIAGGVMVVTLYTSKKARSVIKTSVNLSRQSEGQERFGSSVFARSVVRASISLSDNIGKITPLPLKKFISKRFEQKKSIKKLKQEDAPAFDMIRASVILIVSSILISVATSYKLPLSTTYVTFMVAMGTSLSDKAWGRESAVYRITGVVSVIGGWFFTAISAFTVAFIVGLILYFGGMYAVVAMVLLTGFFIFRTHAIHKKKENAEEEIEKFSRDGGELNIDDIRSVCANNITTILSKVTVNYENSINYIIAQDRKKLKDVLVNVDYVNAETKKLKNNILFTIKRLEESFVTNGHYYVQVLDYVRETAHCLTYITKPGYDHIDNNHKGFIEKQIEDLRYLNSRVVKYLNRVNEIIQTNDFETLESVVELQESIVNEIDLIRKKQIKRIKKDETGTKNSLLFMAIMHETKNLVLYSINLAKAQRDFMILDSEDIN